jgi:hypothetical protein
MDKVKTYHAAAVNFVSAHPKAVVNGVIVLVVLKCVFAIYGLFS